MYEWSYDVQCVMDEADMPEIDVQGKPVCITIPNSVYLEWFINGRLKSSLANTP